MTKWSVAACLYLSRLLFYGEPRFALLQSSMNQSISAAMLLTGLIIAMCSLSHISLCKGVMTTFLTIFSIPVTYWVSYFDDMHPSMLFMLTDPASLAWIDSDD
jgi:hypothetical protein